MPAIIRFLGYNPLPETTTLSEPRSTFLFGSKPEEESNARTTCGTRSRCTTWMISTGY
jgi:hypothetical protein